MEAVVRKSIFLVVVFLIFSVFACNDKYKDGQKVVITGRLRLVGNDPFNKMVITTKDRENFILPNPIKREYKEKVGQQVKVIGILKINTLRSADHKHTFRQMILVKVLSFKRVILKTTK